MTLPVQGLMSANALFGPIMKAVDFIASDVRRKQAEQRELQARREYWQRQEESERKNQ